MDKGFESITISAPALSNQRSNVSSVSDYGKSHDVFTQDTSSERPNEKEVMSPRKADTSELSPKETADNLLKVVKKDGIDETIHELAYGDVDAKAKKNERMNEISQDDLENDTAVGKATMTEEKRLKMIERDAEQMTQAQLQREVEVLRHENMNLKERMRAIETQGEQTRVLLQNMAKIVEMLLLLEKKKTKDQQEQSIIDLLLKLVKKLFDEIVMLETKGKVDPQPAPTMPAPVKKAA